MYVIYNFDSSNKALKKYRCLNTGRYNISVVASIDFYLYYFVIC